MEWKTITREELYKLVWEKPAAQLKKDFEISDVAIAKACRRLEIPKPPRGYWAKLAAGKKIKRTPLPKISKELKEKLAQEKILRTQTEKVENYPTYEPLQRIKLPENNRKLHPVARELREALNLELPDEYEQGRLKIYDRKDLPKITISKAMIQTCTWAFHAIIAELEIRQVIFKAARSKYDSPAFYYGDDRVSISIDEPIVNIKREPTEHEKRRPSWEWSLHSREPSGHLTFNLNQGHRYSNKRNQIKQTAKTDLQSAVAQVVESIWGFFVSEQEERISAKAKWEKELQQREERNKRQAVQDHRDKLASIAQQRKQNLFWAAQWWSIENTTADFIQACEDHWRSNGDDLSQEQREWLEWAKEFIHTLPTANFSYPDPLKDGSFAPDTVEQGGPYPPTRIIPRPPNIPAPPSTAKDTHTEAQHHIPQEKPYPFWLKHQR